MSSKTYGKLSEKDKHALHRKVDKDVVRSLGLSVDELKEAQRIMGEWAKAQGEISRATHGLGPDRADWVIEKFLVDFHAGKIKTPEVTQWILRDLALHIVRGEAKEIRQIADAVGRVAKRCTGEGDAFRVHPKNPALVKIVKGTVGDSTRTNLTKLTEKLNDEGSVAGASKRNVSRVFKRLGKRALKPGAPKGPRLRPRRPKTLM